MRFPRGNDIIDAEKKARIRRFERTIIFPKAEGVCTMSVMFVFSALVVANIAYAVYDSYRSQTTQQMEEFYRVEFRKDYCMDQEYGVL